MSWPELQSRQDLIIAETTAVDGIIQKKHWIQLRREGNTDIYSAKEEKPWTDWTETAREVGGGEIKGGGLASRRGCQGEHTGQPAVAWDEPSDGSFDGKSRGGAEAGLKG